MLQEAATADEVAELRSKVEEGQKAIAQYEDRLKSIEREKEELMKLLQENEKKIEEKAVKSAKDDDGWGNEWPEEEKTVEEVRWLFQLVGPIDWSEVT